MATPAAASPAREEVRGVVPKLIELSEKVLYADVWERPGLSKRDRSLITVAALTAMYRGDQLKGHIERALANGVTRDEIGEVITHMAFYAGWPTAMTAARIAKKLFDEKAVLAVIIEAQLGDDGQKRFAWPASAACPRKRSR